MKAPPRSSKKENRARGEQRRKTSRLRRIFLKTARRNRPAA